MGFQTQVNLYPSPGIVGTSASANPIATIDAGPGALVAGSNGLVVGNFAWISGTTNLGGGTASNACPTAAPYAPDGFSLNQHEALITTWLGQASTVIPAGLPCTLAGRGDFWAVANSSAAVRGNKVFANLYNGAVLAAAAGTGPSVNIGTNASVTASVTAGVMTVTAVASGTLAIGQLIQGAGIPANVYIQSLGTGTGGTGTYNLTDATVTVASETITATSPAGVGGASVTYDTTSASATLTVSAVAYGVIQVGMPISGAGIPAGTYISALGTGTGGAGTYLLSQNASASETGATGTLSAWIETPFYVLSDGNPGDLIKIGVLN